MKTPVFFQRLRAMLGRHRHASSPSLSRLVPIPAGTAVACPVPAVPVGWGADTPLLADAVHGDRHLRPRPDPQPRCSGSCSPSHPRPRSGDISALPHPGCRLHPGALLSTSPSPLVTGLDIWASLLSTGVICTFYTTLVSAGAGGPGGPWGSWGSLALTHGSIWCRVG